MEDSETQAIDTPVTKPHHYTGWFRFKTTSLSFCFQVHMPNLDWLATMCQGVQGEGCMTDADVL
jgi:hypothetical protein